MVYNNYLHWLIAVRSTLLFERSASIIFWGTTYLQLYRLIIRKLTLSDLLVLNFRIAIRQPGDYELCFDNSFSHMTAKMVFFEVYSEFDDESFPSALKQAQQMAIEETAEEIMDTAVDEIKVSHSVQKLIVNTMLKWIVMFVGCVVHLLTGLSSMVRIWSAGARCMWRAHFHSRMPW